MHPWLYTHMIITTIPTVAAAIQTHDYVMLNRQEYRQGNVMKCNDLIVNFRLFYITWVFYRIPGHVM